MDTVAHWLGRLLYALVIGGRSASDETDVVVEEGNLGELVVSKFVKPERRKDGAE